MYNYSKLSRTECYRLHVLLGHITSTCECDYTVTGMTAAIERLRYEDMQELAPVARQEFHEIYDKILMTMHFDKQENITRVAMINFLQLTDRNGTYSDDDMLSEEWAPMSIEQTTEMMHRYFQDLKD